MHLNRRRCSCVRIIFLVLGFLLGSLAEQQKQLRTEKSVITRVAGQGNAWKPDLPYIAGNSLAIAICMAQSYVVLASQRPTPSTSLCRRSALSWNSDGTEIGWSLRKTTIKLTSLILQGNTLLCKPHLNRRFPAWL